MEANLLDDFQLERSSQKRFDLLPWWVKFFMWAFLFFSAILLFFIVNAILGDEFNLSIYGLSTTHPFSLIGIIISLIFAFKGITAFGLLKEKEWAIDLAIADGLIGIFICLLTMLDIPFIQNSEYYDMEIQLDLIVLIAYVWKMQEINSEWKSRIAG